jgi:hypothetical protein
MEWEKLRDRVRQRKSKKRRAAYIWSISIPLAASVIYFFLLPGNNKREPAKTGPTVVSQTKTTITTEQKTPIATTMAAPVLTPVKNNARRQTTTNKLNKNSNGEQMPVVNAPAIVAAIDTTASSAAISPLLVAVPKKLKVIHNNELQGQVSVARDERNMAADVRRYGIFGFRRAEPNSFEDINEDTIKKPKSKPSFLLFNSLISQKE